MKVVALFNPKKRNLRRWMDVIAPANHQTEAVQHVPQEQGSTLVVPWELSAGQSRWQISTRNPQEPLPFQLTHFLPWSHPFFLPQFTAARPRSVQHKGTPCFPRQQRRPRRGGHRAAPGLWSTCLVAKRRAFVLRRRGISIQVWLRKCSVRGML